MDVNELDQSLLHQFSCLGTTDKEELVTQLRELLGGSRLNETAAAFYLDMNNWNLQAAVCSYLDYGALLIDHITLPKMMLCDCTVGDGESVPPNTEFTKTWRVQNTGTKPWPDGIFLKHIEGDKMDGYVTTGIPQLAPQESTEIHLFLKSPENVGDFQSEWRLSTASGSYFGASFWVIISVSESGTLAITQQLHELSTSEHNNSQMW